MRISALIALLGLGLAFLTLAGCSGNEETTRVGFSGVVQTTGRAAVPNATISFFQNGVLITQMTTGPGGTFSIPSLPVGLTTIVITRVVNGTTVNTVVGPINISRQTSGFLISIPSDTDLTALNVIPPTSGQATLVVEANDVNGAPLPNVMVQINAFTPVTGTSPIVIKNFAPITTTVAVTANGRTLTFPNTALAANTVTVIIPQFTPTTTGKFTVSGVVTDTSGTTINNATVQLFDQNGRLVTTTTSGLGGAFTTTALSPGLFTVVVTQVINGTTVSMNVGTVNVTNANVTNFQAIVPTSAALIAAGIIPPTSTSNNSTLVVFATDASGAPVTATVQIDGFTPVTGTSPVVINNVATGRRTVTVTANGQTLAFPGTQFTAGQVTVIQAKLTGTSNNFTIKGTVADTTGATVSGATVSFFNASGGKTGEVSSATDGTFTATGIPAGQTFVVVTQTVNGTTVRTSQAPFTVTGNMSNVAFTVPTTTTLTTAGVIPAPTTTAGTLAVFATDQNNNPITATVQIDAFTPVTGTSPIVISPVTTGTQTVTVTAAGQTQTFNNVNFTAGTVNVIQAKFTVTGATTLSGTLTQGGAAFSGASVTLLQNGAEVSGFTPVTTNAAGQFEFTNVPAGTFTVGIAGPGGTLTTFFGPFTVGSTSKTLPTISILTGPQLQAQFGIAEPPVGAGDIVAIVTDTSGALVPASLTANGQTAQGSASAPAALIDLTPGSTTATVAVDGQTFTFPGIVVPSQSAVIIRIITPTP